MEKHQGLVFLCFLFLISVAAGFEFRVGGPMGWTVPTDPNAMSYNQWAQKSRFHVGDTLLFVYPPYKDSVLQVNEEAYNTCKTSSYINSFNEGNTVVTLDRSGSFYFISGVEANCLKNESLVIVVMAERSKSHAVLAQLVPSPVEGNLTSPPPPLLGNLTSPPPPAEGEVAPPPPSLGNLTSPPPPSLGTLASPPPPAGSIEAAPTATPTPSEASSSVISVIGKVGALLGALLVL